MLSVTASVIATTLTTCVKLQARIKKELQKDVDGSLRLVVPQNVLELLLLLLDANTCKQAPGASASQQLAGPQAHMQQCMHLSTSSASAFITL